MKSFVNKEKNHKNKPLLYSIQPVGEQCCKEENNTEGLTTVCGSTLTILAVLIIGV
jgi:hypothetical protein